MEHIRDFICIVEIVHASIKQVNQGNLPVELFESLFFTYEEAIFKHHNPLDKVRQDLVASLVREKFSLQKAENLYHKIILDAIKQCSYIPEEKTSIKAYMHRRVGELKDKIPDSVFEVIFYQQAEFYHEFTIVPAEQAKNFKADVKKQLTILDLKRRTKSVDSTIIIRTLANFGVPQFVLPEVPISLTPEQIDTAKSLSRQLKNDISPVVYSMLGNIFFYAEEYARAKVMYQKGLKVAPHDETIRINLAHLAINFLDDDHLGFILLEKLLAERRDFGFAWHVLGTYYTKHGHPNRAVEAYKSAVIFDPNNALSWNNLGVLYKDMGQLDHAIQSYQRAIRINQHIATLWNNVGVVKYLQNKTDEAKASFQRALQLKPEYAECLTNLATLYGDEDNLEEEIKLYYHALQINPKVAMTWNNLGVAYSQANKDNEALTCFGKALELNPHLENAKQNYNEAQRRIKLTHPHSVS